MNTFKNSVSVIIASYNAYSTIERAINSVLNEEIISEVIVVDDASTDDTVARVKSIYDNLRRIKLLVQEKNQGPSAARNRAIDACTSEWICVLDSDDYFLENRVSSLLCYQDKADLIADDLWQVSEDNIEGPRKKLLGDYANTPRHIKLEEFVLSNISQKGRDRGELGFIKPLMRRSFIEKHKLRYNENLRLGEDYEFYARALALGAELYLVPPQGYVSVIRKNSLSGRHTEDDLLHLRDSDLSLAQMPNLGQNDRVALRKHYLSLDCRLQWRLLINAVKERSPRKALASFIRPYPVPLYLLSQLGQQVVQRTQKRLKGS